MRIHRSLMIGLAMFADAAADAAPRRATYDLVSTRYDMQLDRETLLWKGRSREVRRLHVDGPAGLEEGRFSVHRSSLVEIEAVRVRVRHAGERDWRDAELETSEHSPWSEFADFSDSIEREHIVHGLRIGDDLEIEIRQRHRSAWEIPPCVFGGPDSIRQQVFEIAVPAGIEMTHHIAPGMLGWPSPRFETAGDRESVLRFVADRLPPAGDLDESSPPILDLLPVVRVAPARFVRAARDTIPVRRTWADFATWYEARVAPLLELDSQALARVAQLRAKAPNRDAVVANLYAMVQREVRYVAIEVGEGGWIPHSPALTWGRKYGDCKDMSVLLVALLRAAQIPAHMALVRTRGGGSVDTTFAYAMSFDHCIAYVPDPAGDWWLDATSGIGRAGKVANFITANPALVVAGANTRFATPAHRDGSTSKIEQHFDVGMESAGRSAMRFRFAWHGPIEEDVRHALEGAEPRRRVEIANRLLRESFTGIEDVALEASPSASPVLMGRCSVASLLSHDTAGLGLARGATLLALPTISASRQRPLQLDPRACIESSTVLHLPAPATVDSLILERDSEFATLRIETRVVGREVRCERSLAWKREVVAGNRVGALAEFLLAARTANDEVFVIRFP